MTPEPAADRPLSRRTVLTGAAVVGAASVAGATPALGAGARKRPARGRSKPYASQYPALPDPASSGLDHIVVVCMENRSFDHYLGWVAGADGKQAGLTYKDERGTPHPTHHLFERQGCGFNDPDHSYQGGRTQLNGGAMDGFRRGGNDDFALGYYRAADLPLYGPLLDVAATYDRYFASILAPTYPNRFYTHAATTDRIDNTSSISSLPTIWDRLDAAGVPSRYYFSDVPFLGLFGTKHLKKARPVEQFFLDALSGSLPPFSYVDPSFLGEGQGGTYDDHPHADILRGQSFVSSLVRAVTHGPKWTSTAIVITYDEWGGFFDHVRPPRLPDDHDTGPKGTDDHAQAGFRVPTIVISPFARRGHIGHNVYDHASIVRMIRWRFGLPALTKRDANVRNLAESLDFVTPHFGIPETPLIADPGPHLCSPPFGTTIPTGAPVMGLEDPFWRDLTALIAQDRRLRAWEHVMQPAPTLKKLQSYVS